MAILITGVAGFIGSNLAKVLLTRNNKVFGIDNFSRGTLAHIQDLIDLNNFIFSKIEMNDLAEYRKAFRSLSEIEPITEVWHLAANSDIPAGVENANVDLRDTFMTTFNTLQLMKEFKVRIFMFASSSAVYGDLGPTSLTETTGPLLPISNYGAMKLASEAAISAAAEVFIDRAFIFRFPNVVGIPATHGVLLDFIRKLSITTNKLTVLGNGTQKKSYLHVDELIDAMLFICKKASENVNIYNIGPNDEGVTVKFIAEQVVEVVSKNAVITFGEEDRGWVGDVPQFVYAIDKLRLLGWEPRIHSSDAIRRSIIQIVAQETAK